MAKFYSKRVLTNVASLLPYTDNGYLVCLTKEAIQIIRNYLSGPALWETSYIKAIVSETEYTTPSREEFDIIDAIVSEAIYSLTEENLMPICEINEGLKYLADALCACGGIGGSCCGPAGAGGAGNTDGPATEEVVDRPGGIPPTGFEDITEYNAYACGVATWIVSTILSDLSNITLINLVGMTLTALIPAILALLVTPVPGDEVILIAGLILAGWALGDAIADTANDLVSTAFDDFVCALYSASSVDEAKSQFMDLVDSEMTTQGVATLLQPLVRGILDNLTSNANLNRLFEKDDTFEYPEGDCSGCIDECEYITASYHLDAVNATGSEWWVYFDSSTFPELEGCCFTIDDLVFNSYPGLGGGSCGVYFQGCPGYDPSYGCQHVGPATGWDWSSDPSQSYYGTTGLQMRGDGGAWSIDIDISYFAP